MFFQAAVWKQQLYLNLPWVKHRSVQQHRHQVLAGGLIVKCKNKVHLTTRNPCEQEWNINTTIKWEHSADGVKGKEVNSGFVWVERSSAAYAKDKTSIIFYIWSKWKVLWAEICSMSLVYGSIYCRPNQMKPFWPHSVSTEEKNVLITYMQYDNQTNVLPISQYGPRKTSSWWNKNNYLFQMSIFFFNHDTQIHFPLYEKTLYNTLL